MAAITLNLPDIPPLDPGAIADKTVAGVKASFAFFKENGETTLFVVVGLLVAYVVASLLYKKVAATLLARPTLLIIMAATVFGFAGAVGTATVLQLKWLNFMDGLPSEVAPWLFGLLAWFYGVERTKRHLVNKGVVLGRFSFRTGFALPIDRVKRVVAGPVPPVESVPDENYLSDRAVGANWREYRGVAYDELMDESAIPEDATPGEIFSLVSRRAHVIARREAPKKSPTAS